MSSAPRHTMQVRALRSFVSPLASAAPGDVFAVPPETAVEWIRAGLVEPVRPVVEEAVRQSHEVAVTRKRAR